MKLITLKTVLLLLLTVTGLSAQNTTPQIYDPTRDPFSQVEQAIKSAEGNRHILLQIGGNWCKWCRMFEKWSRETPQIDSLLKADFIIVHVNYSKENKNESFLKSLEFPQRFGFPVFVILDEKGRRLHTQNSAYLEEGEGYSEKKVTEFLRHWNKAAVSEKSYLPKP